MRCMLSPKSVSSSSSSVISASSLKLEFKCEAEIFADRFDDNGSVGATRPLVPTGAAEAIKLSSVVCWLSVPLDVLPRRKQTDQNAQQVSQENSSASWTTFEDTPKRIQFWRKGELIILERKRQQLEIRYQEKCNIFVCSHASRRPRPIRGRL